MRGSPVNGGDMHNTSANPRRSFTLSWEAIPPYLYLGPAFAVYAVFFLWPLAHLIQLSTLRWSGLGPRAFVGLQNYRSFFAADPNAWLAFRHNLAWLLAAMVVPLVIGLSLAVLLARSRLRGRLLFRTVYFLPQVLSSVVVGVIWRGMYNPNYGAVNSILGTVGLGMVARGWLGDRVTALPALFVAWSWIHYGFCMVIFLAALQGIEETYYDAAKVDGANALQQIWHVALPFIRRPLAIVILLTAISAFQVFDLVLVTTNGGPASATLVLSLHMYNQAFTYDKVGYGSAVAVVLGALVTVFSGVFQYLRSRLEAE